jgi:diketogulonate reductase-like aldo/keto reductase
MESKPNTGGGWTGVFEEDRLSESLIDLCEQEQMVFLPWAPIQNVDRNRIVREIAQRYDATPRQIVLAWLWPDRRRSCRSRAPDRCHT